MFGRARGSGANHRARAQGRAPERPPPASFGPLFRDLRQFLRLTPEQLAANLGTHVEVVYALEFGRVDLLPPWPETARVVCAYTGLAGIDPMPVLNCMARNFAPPGGNYRARLAAHRRYAGHAVRTASTWLGGAAWIIYDLTFAQVGRLARGISARPWLRLAIALGVSAAFMLIFTQTALLQASVSSLPQPLARVFRSTQDYMLYRLAPVRDGLRWIEVDDPRSRRGDKLRVVAR